MRCAAAQPLLQCRRCGGGGGWASHVKHGIMLQAGEKAEPVGGRAADDVRHTCKLLKMKQAMVNKP